MAWQDLTPRLLYLEVDEEILGAILVDEKRIIINPELLEEQHGKSNGRYFFTCAHELGHWILHRNLKKRNIYCRTIDKHQYIEWQANYFASCLLMPSGSIQKAFRGAFGRDRLEIFNIASSIGTLFGYDPCVNNWPFIAEEVIKSGSFTNVSRQAMMIRLLDLGLVVNHTKKHFWNDK